MYHLLTVILLTGTFYNCHSLDVTTDVISEGAEGSGDGDFTVGTGEQTNSLSLNELFHLHGRWSCLRRGDFFVPFRQFNCIVYKKINIRTRAVTFQYCDHSQIFDSRRACSCRPITQSTTNHCGPDILEFTTTHSYNKMWAEIFGNPNEQGTSNHDTPRDQLEVDEDSAHSVIIEDSNISSNQQRPHIHQPISPADERISSNQLRPHHQKTNLADGSISSNQQGPHIHQKNNSIDLSIPPNQLRPHIHQQNNSADGIVDGNSHSLHTPNVAESHTFQEGNNSTNRSRNNTNNTNKMKHILATAPNTTAEHNHNTHTP